MRQNNEFLEMLARVNEESNTKSIIINIDCSVTTYEPKEDRSVTNPLLTMFSNASSARKVMFDSYVEKRLIVGDYDNEQVG